MESGEASLEEALRAYPELRPELEPLLSLAVELRSMPRISAPESLRSLRRPVFASAAHDRDARPRMPLGWRILRPSPAWVAPLARLAAGLILAFLLLGGTMVASADSLPEEPLYPLKLALENAQLALTSDPVARAELEMQFAGRRLQEVELAARQGKTAAVEQGLALYERQIEGAVDRAQTATQSPTESRQLQDALARQQEVLERVYQQVPAAAQPAILHAIQASQKGAAQSGKESGNQGEKGSETTHSPQGTSAPQPPGRVLPSEAPGKGHESTEKQTPSPVPMSTTGPMKRQGDGEAKGSGDAGTRGTMRAGSVAGDAGARGRGDPGSDGVHPASRDGRATETPLPSEGDQGWSRSDLPPSASQAQELKRAALGSVSAAPVLITGSPTPTPTPVGGVGSTTSSVAMAEPGPDRQGVGGGRNDRAVSTFASNPGGGNGKNGRGRDPSP